MLSYWLCFYFGCPRDGRCQFPSLWYITVAYMRDNRGSFHVSFLSHLIIFSGGRQVLSPHKQDAFILTTGLGQTSLLSVLNHQGYIDFFLSYVFGSVTQNISAIWEIHTWWFRNRQWAALDALFKDHNIYNNNILPYLQRNFAQYTSSPWYKYLLFAIYLRWFFSV